MPDSNQHLRALAQRIGEAYAAHPQVRAVLLPGFDNSPAREQCGRARGE